MDNKMDEVEKLAWEIFEKKSGLQFRRDLTPERITEIIGMIPDYRQYRDAAVKLYDERLKKKERAELNPKYPVIQVPSTGRHGWNNGARVLCFVYSKHKGNFVLEGYYGEVKDYLQKNYTKYFYYMSFWHNGNSRGFWHFWKERDVSITEPSKKRKEWKWKITSREPRYSYSQELKTKYEISLKRLPKRWIPEFDKL